MHLTKNLSNKDKKIIVMKKYTLHTHTVGFDGQDSVRAMVECARDKGFNTIGISNHFIVNPLIKKTTPDLPTEKWGGIKADETGRTGMKNVYAGGDAVTGAATVILAMGAGKKAAAAILEDHPD